VRASATQTWIGTKVLIGISVAVFVADLLFDHRILMWGAVSHAIWAGEWHRLLAPHFIHSGVPHILFNMYALYIFGRLVEGMIGTRRFLTVYFVGGITGFYFSLLARPQGLAVGASAAIFALMGFTLHYRLRRLPMRWLSIDSSFAQILGLNLIIGLTVPNIDQFAHLGGLIGGALAGSLVGFPRTLYEVQEDGGEPGSWTSGGRRPKRRRLLEPLLAAVLIGVLSWAALSPLTFARASGLPGLARFADERYGGYFAPYVATDVTLLWLLRDDPESEWQPVRERLQRAGASPVAIGLFWRWERGGGRDASGEYVVRWYRYDARVNQWSLWHVEPGRVDRVDPQEGLIYRRGLIVESGAGELDGRWRVTIAVDGRQQYDREFWVSPAL